MIYEIKRDLRIRQNQIDLPEDYDSNSGTSIYNLNCTNFLHYDLDLRTITLNCKTKLTDIGAQVFCTNALVVKNKVYEVMQSFKLPTHRAFPVNIKNNDQIFQFYLVFFCFDIFEHVDFSESTFFIENEMHNKSEVELKNFDEYKSLLDKFHKDLNRDKSSETDPLSFPKIGAKSKIIESMQERIRRIGYDNLILKGVTIDKYDLIYHIGKFYLSERLKSKFYLMDFSGFHLEPPKNIQCR